MGNTYLSLPQTGGEGVRLFTTIGIAIRVVAAVAFVISKIVKKKNEDKEEHSEEQ